MKSRADYFKSRRTGKKNFSVYISEEESAKLERKLSGLQKSKTDWLKQKIQEELKMNLVWDITCPYCGKSFEVDLDQYVSDTSGSEREMGTETEYTIECEEFICPECKKEFGIQGSVWEYPEGAYNDDTIETIEYEEEEDEEE